MRQIYVSHSTISKLKKEAKRRQRESGLPHHEILDEIAKRAGLPNWHHLTLAEKASEQVNAKFKSGLYALFDVKDGAGLVGDGFTDAMLELHAFLMGDIVAWMRAKYPDSPEETDADMRAHISDNYICLAYTGNKKLPAAGEIVDWFKQETFFPPMLVWLRGRQIDVFTAISDATGIPEPSDDDVEGEHETMPDIDGDELLRVFAPQPSTNLVLNQPIRMEYYRAFVAKRAAWHWCLHCERAYPLGCFRQEGEYQMCPYEGCDGTAVTDLWTWKAVRDSNPGYPEVPQLGVTYPLYPPEPQSER